MEKKVRIDTTLKLSMEKKVRKLANEKYNGNRRLALEHIVYRYFEK